MHAVTVHTNVHRTNDTHSDLHTYIIKCVHECMSSWSFFFFVSDSSDNSAKIHTTSKVWKEKSCCQVQRLQNTSPSVIQAAEEAQITTQSPELQLACNEGLKKTRCKTNTFRRSQWWKHADLFELEQSLGCCCSVLDAEVYLQFHAHHLSEED